MKEDREMPPMRRIARRTARRTASRQAGAPPESQPAAAPETAAPATPAASTEPAYMAELEQLNQLKEQGILSEEEYAAKKAQILGI
jgi:Short C-terminal domain